MVGAKGAIGTGVGHQLDGIAWQAFARLAVDQLVERLSDIVPVGTRLTPEVVIGGFPAAVAPETGVAPPVQLVVDVDLACHLLHCVGVGCMNRIL